jgi:RNA polymerase sigma-70 factor (sigma-E family)
VRDAEEREFAEYVAARLVPLRRLGYLVCGDWHLAEDAVSAVLAKLYLAWADARKADRIDSYVRRMLLHAIVDERRRPWRRERPTEFSPAYSPDPLAAGGTEDRVVLEGALRQMPARRRAVLVLRFFEGLSVEETAAAMGCTGGTVKSQTARGLATLRELLPADYLTANGGAA